jgi:hypothetical protein
MARADFLQLPMHARALAIIDLHAVHADIAFAVSGSLVTTHGRVMNVRHPKASIAEWED